MEPTYRTRNPTTGELLERYRVADENSVELALRTTVSAFADWRRRSLAERCLALENIALQLEARTDELAHLMALEMGKPVAQGRAEVAKCAWVCRYYAETSEAMLRETPHQSDGSAAWVRYDPLGPLLAIMPWNFPLWQVFRCIAPALAAGNTVLLKHAPCTPKCALRIESLIREAGLPTGVVQNLFLDISQVARAIHHPSVRGVSLTGSTRAGREVAAVAGAALKPMIAELGGSDPFIIFADADLELAVDTGVTSRCLNSGQSCIAAKRFLIAVEVFDQIVDDFTRRMSLEIVGDPMNEATTIGPLAREDLVTTLADQVGRSSAEGAALVFGGRPEFEAGYFFPPTLLTSAGDTTADSEELFGPVGVLVPFRDEDEAVSLANQTRYGLGATVFTNDQRRADRLVPELDAGSVFVNGMVKSDPRLPFGGVKDSGFGRELGREGLVAFSNIKTVWTR